jgi:hypothetical protein
MENPWGFYHQPQDWDPGTSPHIQNGHARIHLLGNKTGVAFSTWMPSYKLRAVLF